MYVFILYPVLRCKKGYPICTIFVVSILTKILEDMHEKNFLDEYICKSY